MDLPLGWPPRPLEYPWCSSHDSCTDDERHRDGLPHPNEDRDSQAAKRLVEGTSIVSGVFDFTGAPVSVRQDLRDAYAKIWRHLASPGPTLTAIQRIALAEFVRASAGNAVPPRTDQPEPLLHLAATLFADPGDVDATIVTSAADAAGDPVVVEVISLVSMLSAVDGAHRALTADPEPLPSPVAGDPTGEISRGLTRRRTHVPMPAGAIPVALDLLPAVGEAFRDSFGPQYMTEAEMGSDLFERSPGLNRAQIELVSTRTSLHNRCFY